MKKSKFLIKLHGEGKLTLVGQSNELVQSYLNKSRSHFESSKILLKAGKLEESVSMAYYGMYHCLMALFFKVGIKCENHAASIMLLDTLFNEKELSKELEFGKKERIDKQYYTDFKITNEDCQDMIKIAENFIVQCKVIIKKLDEESTEKIRERFNKIILY